MNRCCILEPVQSYTTVIIMLFRCMEQASKQSVMHNNILVVSTPIFWLVFCVLRSELSSFCTLQKLDDSMGLQYSRLAF